MSDFLHRIGEERERGEKIVKGLQQEAQRLKNRVANPVGGDTSEGGRNAGMLTYEECAAKFAGEKFIWEDKIEESERDMAKYTQDAERLTKDNDDLKRENETLQKNGEEDTQIINDLESKVEKLGEEKDDLESENEQLHKEKNTLEAELKSCHDSHDQIVANTNAAMKEMEKTRATEAKDLAESSTPTITEEHQAQTDTLVEAHEAERKQYQDKLQSITLAIASIQSIPDLYISLSATGDLPAQLHEIHTSVHGIITEMHGMMKQEDYDSQLANKDRDHKEEVDELELQMENVGAAIEKVLCIEDFQKYLRGTNPVENINIIHEMIENILDERKVLNEELDKKCSRDSYFHEILELVKKALRDDNESLDVKVESDQNKLMEALRLFVTRINEGDLVTKQECDERSMGFIKDRLVRGELLTSAEFEERILVTAEELASTKALIDEINLPRKAEGMDERELENKQKAAFFNKTMDLLNKMTNEDGFASEDIQQQGEAVLSAIKYISIHTDDERLMLTRTKHDELQQQLVAENTTLKAQVAQGHSSISLPMTQPAVLISSTASNGNELLEIRTELEKKLKEQETSNIHPSTATTTSSDTQEALKKCHQTVSEHKDEIKNLKTKISDLEKKLKDAQSKEVAVPPIRISAISDLGSTTQTALSECQKENEEYQEAINDLLAANTDLETQLQTLRSATPSEDLQDALNTAQRTNEEHKDLISSLLHQIDTLQATLKNQNRGNDAGMLSPKSEEALHKCKQSNVRFKTEINDLTAEVKNLQKDIAESEARSRGLEKEKKDLLGKVEELRIVIEGLEEDNVGMALASQTPAVGGAPRAHTEEINLLKKKIAELEATIHDLEMHDTRRILAMATASQVPTTRGGPHTPPRTTNPNNPSQPLEGITPSDSPEQINEKIAAMTAQALKLKSEVKTQAQHLVSQGMIISPRAHKDEVDRLNKRILQLQNQCSNERGSHQESVRLEGDMSRLNTLVHDYSIKMSEWIAWEKECEAAATKTEEEKGKIVAELVAAKKEIVRLEEGPKVLERELKGANEKLTIASEGDNNTSTESGSPRIEPNQRIIADLRDQIRILEEAIKSAKDEHATELKRSLDASSTCEQEKRNKDAIISSLRKQLSHPSSEGAGRKPSTESDSSSAGKTQPPDLTSKNEKITDRDPNPEEKRIPGKEIVHLRSTRTDIEFCLVRTEEGLNAMASERRVYGFTQDDTRAAQDAADMARRLSEAIPDFSHEKELLMARSNFWAGITTYYAQNPDVANALLAAARSVTNDLKSYEAKHYWAWVKEGTGYGCPTTRECYKGFRLGYGFTKGLGSAFTSPEQKQKPFQKNEKNMGLAKKKKRKNLQEQTSIPEKQPDLYNDSDKAVRSLAKGSSIAEPPVLLRATHQGESKGEPLKKSTGTIKPDNATSAAQEKGGQSESRTRTFEEGGKLTTNLQPATDFLQRFRPSPVDDEEEEFAPDEESEIPATVKEASPQPTKHEDVDDSDDDDENKLGIVGSVKSVGKFFTGFFGGN